MSPILQFTFALHSHSLYAVLCGYMYAYQGKKKLNF